MKSEYKDIHNQAERLYFRFKDKVDQPDAPEMQALLREIREVAEDIESDKQPRSIEDRIKHVMSQLESLKHSGGTMMDASDADELQDGYEDIRNDLRELPNY